MCMSDHEPKLVSVTEAAFGSLLTLSDGRVIPINISPTRLREAIHEARPAMLAAYFQPEPLGVYADDWLVASEDWDRICAIMQSSHTAARAFGHVPAIWDGFSLPASVVRNLPQRVYGGLWGGIYTSLSFNFKTDSNRSVPWVYAQLHASEGRLFQTWVNMKNGKVEVECGVRMGHYVE